MMRRFLLAAFFVAAALQANAQDVTVVLGSDSSRVLIGTWFPARISVHAPAEYKIQLPGEDKDFVRAAFVSADSAFVERKADGEHYSREYTLAVFDTGTVSISAIIRYYKPGDTTAYTTASNEITLTVASVKIDTTKSFRDIKDVLDVPWTWWDYALLFGGLIAAGLLGYYLWHRYRLKQRKEEALPEPELEPEIPAEIRAMERLRALEQEKLWEQGMHKEYQSELTETIREYIEKKLRVPALEETTPEIIKHVALKGIEPKLIQELEIALQCADLTKFAKYIPDPVAHRQSMRTAYLFVEETKDFNNSIEMEVRLGMTRPAAAPVPAADEDSHAQSQPNPENSERRDGDVR